MSGSNSRHAPPAKDALQARDGSVTKAWQNHFQDVADEAFSAFSIGDYKQTAQPDLGRNWLLCDGRTMNDADYPVLSAIIKPLLGPGAAAGTFVLPAVSAQQAGTPPVAILSTWIRAA